MIRHHPTHPTHPVFGRFAGAGGGAFTPADLMSGDQDNAWYVASDETLFQDTGKATPADTDGDGIDLIAAGEGSTASFDRLAYGGVTRQTRSGVTVARYDGVDGYSEKAWSWTGPNTFMFVGYNEDGVQHRLQFSADDDNATRQHVIIQEDNTLTLYARSVGMPIAVAPDVPVGWFCLLVEFDGDNSTVAINGHLRNNTTTPGDNTVSGGNRTAANNNSTPGEITAYDEVAFVALNRSLTWQESIDLMEWGMSLIPLAAPTLARTTDSYGPIDVSKVRVGSSSVLNRGSVSVPSYLGYVVDVQGDSDFDGVENDLGERLNYLMYSGPDHGFADPSFGGGCYLTCIFGDPITGTWKRYDDALSDGDLADFTGSKPVVTDGLMLNYTAGTNREECETPAVIKIGSTWNMLFQIKGADDAPANQATLHATSSSPFGPWTVTDAGSDEMFLSTDEPGASHTGYAIIYPTPANCTQTAAHLIHSLYKGSTGATFASWTADATLTRASVEALGNARIPWKPVGYVSPSGEVDEGEQLKFPINNHTVPRWNGTNFTTLGTGVTEGVGIDPQTSIIYEMRMDVDLEAYDETYSPQMLLKRNDFNAFFPHDLAGMTRPQVHNRPGGGSVIFFDGDGIDAKDNFFMCAPISVSI